MSSSKEETTPPSKEDVAQTYREITKGEQTAAALEANLTNLESKLDAILAAFEAQEGEGQEQPQGNNANGAQREPANQEKNGDSSKSQ